MSSPFVELFEVGPRDGLQNIKTFVPTERKVRLILDLIDAGCRRIEVASFVNPKVVPQMADGEAVLAQLPKRKDVVYSAVVPNPKGLERAMNAGVQRICIGTAATDAFQQANMNATVAESLERVDQILDAARGAALRIAGYVSCFTDCPYSGPVAPGRAAEVADALFQRGCHEIFLAETIGKGTVSSVARGLDAVLKRIPAGCLGMHFHDTYGQALANIVVGLERGINRIDSSVAGLGGCPFAPGAAGNVATEDVLYLLEGMEKAPDIDMAKIAGVGAAFCEEFNLTYASKAGRALRLANRGDAA